MPNALQASIAAGGALKRSSHLAPAPAAARSRLYPAARRRSPSRCQPGQRAATAAGGDDGHLGRSGSVQYSGAGRAGSAGFGSEQSIAPTKWWDARRLQQQIQAYGLAGVVAYGLLNSLYYTCAFLFFWIYVFKVPTGLGTKQAATQFLTVFAAVWAGSQATKLLRAAGALGLAPLVDRGLTRLQAALRLRTRRAAFLVVVAACLTLALSLFATVVLLWS